MSYEQEDNPKGIKAQNDTTFSADKVDDTTHTNKQNEDSSPKGRRENWREFVKTTSRAISIELCHCFGQDPFMNNDEFNHMLEVAEKDLHRIFNRPWLRSRQHKVNVQPSPQKDPTKKDGKPKKDPTKKDDEPKNENN